MGRCLSISCDFFSYLCLPSHAHALDSSESGALFLGEKEEIMKRWMQMLGLMSIGYLMAANEGMPPPEEEPCIEPEVRVMEEAVVTPLPDGEPVIVPVEEPAKVPEPMEL